MAQVPTGTTFYIASAFGASKNTTIVTNASEAVVTSAAHGYSNGDIIEITSGWGRLNLRAFRIKSVTTDTFVLEDIDTTGYPAFTAGNFIIEPGDIVYVPQSGLAEMRKFFEAIQSFTRIVYDVSVTSALQN